MNSKPIKPKKITKNMSLESHKEPSSRHFTTSIKALAELFTRKENFNNYKQCTEENKKLDASNQKPKYNGTVVGVSITRAHK